jgi:peptidoglycan hydrolase-like protein with peptidoglycan-binding domain
MVALVCLLLVGGLATVALAYTQMNSASAKDPWASCPKTVSYGSSGATVKALQRRLNDRYEHGFLSATPYTFHYPLQVDGSFGSQTLAAVKDYQQQQDVKADGVVGPHTWHRLGYYGCPVGK